MFEWERERDVWVDEWIEVRTDVLSCVYYICLLMFGV